MQKHLNRGEYEEKKHRQIQYIRTTALITKKKKQLTNIIDCFFNSVCLLLQSAEPKYIYTYNDRYTGVHAPQETRPSIYLHVAF